MPISVSSGHASQNGKKTWQLTPLFTTYNLSVCQKIGDQIGWFILPKLDESSSISHEHRVFMGAILFSKARTASGAGRSACLERLGGSSQSWAWWTCERQQLHGLNQQSSGVVPTIRGIYSEYDLNLGSQWLSDLVASVSECLWGHSPVMPDTHNGDLLSRGKRFTSYDPSSATQQELESARISSNPSMSMNIPMYPQLVGAFNPPEKYARHLGLSSCHIHSLEPFLMGFMLYPIASTGS